VGRRHPGFEALPIPRDRLGTESRPQHDWNEIHGHQEAAILHKGRSRETERNPLALDLRLSRRESEALLLHLEGCRTSMRVPSKLPTDDFSGEARIEVFQLANADTRKLDRAIRKGDHDPPGTPSDESWAKQ